MSAPRLRSRRQWAALAERAEVQHIAGQLEADADGGVTGLFITAGPKFYAKRVHERFAAQRGFILRSIRRQPPAMINPVTGEPNHCYLVRLERRQ